MKEFLISPPFGNWISNSKCERVLGSFTWEKRTGLIYHTIKSLRKVNGGYLNKIGLRNCGIRNVNFSQENIYSLVGLEKDDWKYMLDFCPEGLRVEVNLGCPNVHEYGIEHKILKEYCQKFDVIAKLPATDKVYDVADMCMDTGVNYLHCCNTLPTDRGGESGTRLKKFVLPVIEKLSHKYPCIAGGGIYGPSDIVDYRKAGAKHFSLSTIFFTPSKLNGILY